MSHAIFNRKEKIWTLWKNDGDFEICSLCGKELSLPFYYCEDKERAFCSKGCEGKSKCTGTARKPEHIHLLITEVVSKPVKSIMKKEYY